MLQTLALALYRNPISQAILKSRTGQRVFQEAYFLYKAAEAADARQLRSYVNGDHWIIDVGANIGFFTILFAGWLDGGKVLALEPEPRNCRQLEQIVRVRGLAEHVLVRQLAAADFKGRGRLALSAESHADHRLGENGIPIDVDTLDNIWDDYNRPLICLIKIDVQGAEDKVLAGAKTIIQVCRPALYIEIDVARNGDAVDRARKLLMNLDRIGYRPHSWCKEWMALSPEQTLAQARQNAGHYADFLFLPTPHPVSGS